MKHNSNIRHSLKMAAQAQVINPFSFAEGKTANEPSDAQFSEYIQTDSRVAEKSQFFSATLGWSKSLLLKLVMISAFLLLTNTHSWPRISLLLEQGRFETLIPYIAILLVSVVAIFVIGLQPKLWVRLPLTALICLSTAIAWGYASASKSELNVFEFLSLWNARHESGRAANFYFDHIVGAAGVFVASMIILNMPGSIRGGAAKWFTRLAPLSLAPAALIAGVVYLKAGGGSQAMPPQFAPIAISALAGFKIATQEIPDRLTVTWQPDTKAPKSNIVLLIDESVVADFIDLTPGNLSTPKLATYRDRFVDFGRAVSAGDCSNYSNAMLRLAASRSDLVNSVNTSPTIWQYAKRAGYRTVFIDGQAGNISNPGLLQNFMSMREKSQIDVFHAIRGVAAHEADNILSDLIAKELKSDRPTFIYANKNGAHFPYDDAYPAEAGKYFPTMTTANADTETTRIVSYRNAVAWSVDQFMDRLMQTADFSKTVLIYTSDHGQGFDTHTLTHCVVDNPNPQMAVVPLLAMAADSEVQSKLRSGATANWGRASHFQIIPTLLDLMGYRANDIATRYDENLYVATKHPPEFTSGDVFGLFSKSVRWWPVDLRANHLPKLAIAK
jgi:glucan phosphoethanolaminetransferase (alkaline phosphatase superfamily)